MNKRAKIMENQHKVIVVKRIVTIFLILLMFATVVFAAQRIQENGGGLQGILAVALGEDKESLENLQPLRILVMGISGEKNYKLADTIMIASYDPKNQSAALMSIPRDSYVGAESKDTASTNYLQSYKMNAVYRNGTAIPTAMARISDVTGLDIKNYVIIDTAALIKLVDAIGGVTFDVPMDMEYDDDTQNLHINLKAGEQLIDGPKAEQLLRFRHCNDGTTYPSSYGQQDLGRMRTQREFITATLKQTLKVQNVFKIKQILGIMESDVKTNVDFNLLKKYVPYAVEFNADDLKTGVLPGSVQMCNGVSIYVPNKTRTDALVKELFLGLTTESDTTAKTVSK